MWRETNIFGIYLSPLLVYMAVALLVYVILWRLLLWAGAFRWVWNPPLAELAIYLCILGALVICL